MKPENELRSLFYTRKQARLLLNLSLRTVDYLLEKGDLPFIKIGSNTMIPCWGLQRFIVQRFGVRWYGIGRAVYLSDIHMRIAACHHRILQARDMPESTQIERNEKNLILEQVNFHLGKLYADWLDSVAAFDIELLSKTAELNNTHEKPFDPFRRPRKRKINA